MSALDSMRSYFKGRPEDDFKVVVVHHHLKENRPAFGRGDVATGADKAFESAAACGVDLILCGHYHISNVTAYPSDSGQSVIVSAAGTATSSRGRGEHKSVNMYSWVTVQSERITVEERKFDPGAGRFFAEHASRFERGTAVET